MHTCRGRIVQHGALSRPHAASGADDDKQKFFFDLRGWLVLSAVLSDGELEAMRAECYAGVDPLEERPGGLKYGISGVLQTLLDHPGGGRSAVRDPVGAAVRPGRVLRIPL